MTDEPLVGEASGAAWQTSPFAPRYRTVTVGMLTLIALSAFESLAVTTTMPAVVRALGGLELYAMAFAGPIASGIVGMVAAGGWADRRGPARPLLTGVALFAAGLLVAGSATVMPMVVAGRVVQGLGSGMLTVALYVVVARVFPSSVQPRVFAAFAAAWVVPAVVGPAVAGLIADHLGWRWVFLGIPLLVLPAVAALRPALARVAVPGTGVGPGALDPSGGSVSPRASVARLVQALGTGTGALTLHWGGQQRGLVAAGALVAGFALLAVTVPHLLPRGTLRVTRGLPSVIVVRGLLGAAFFGAEVYLPLLFIQERGLSQAGAGVALMAAALLWSAGSWLRGRREGVWEDGAVLRWGATALMTGIACAALAVVQDVPVAVSLAGWGLSGFGMGLAYPTLSLLTLRLSPVAEQGANSSALQLNESLAIVLTLAVSGPVFATLVVDHVRAAYLFAFAGAALLAAAAAVAAGRVRAGA